MVDLLRRRLSSHEDAVLAGEITYSVWREQAEEPAVRMRQAIARLSRNATISEGDLLALRIASVDFASLLVQLAANAAASGQAGGAPEEPSAELAAKVSSVIAELASRAQEVERPVSDRADVVAHHLAAGLRVRVPQETLQRLARNLAQDESLTGPFWIVCEIPGCVSRPTSTRPWRHSTLSSPPRRTTNAPNTSPARSPTPPRT